MKNIYLIILSCILLLGCYEEDVDVPLPAEERLILGNWEGSRAFLIFKDGSEALWDKNRCVGHLMDFYEDGRLWYFDYMRNPALDNSCVENQKIKQDSRWKRISKGNYEFAHFREIDNSELIVNPDLIEFKGSNSEGRTMTIHYSTPPENVTQDVVSYYIIFNKK